MPASNVDYLNIEYFLVRAYEALTGSGAHLSSVPDWTIAAVTFIVITGMGLTFILLVAIVYAQIRLHQVEHAGFHQIEGEEHAMHAPESGVEGKNDRWERIVELASGPSEGDWRRAILEADIMLGDVLGAQGYPGDSVGEQLRHANPIQMTTLDLAWKAHKMRNDVAHSGENLVLSERDVQTTINYYKRVFEEFGVI